jgi:hypothetical protein
MRLVADTIGVFVFVRLALQLIDNRSALLDAGLPRNLVSWLVANAIVVAVIVVGIVALYGWRAWRRARVRSTAPTMAASLAAVALVLGPLPACVVAPRVTSTPATDQRPERAEVVSPDTDEDGRTTSATTP